MVPCARFPAQHATLTRVYWTSMGARRQRPGAGVVSILYVRSAVGECSSVSLGSQSGSNSWLVK